MTQLRLKPAFSEAWQKVKGAKGPFFWVLMALALLQGVFYLVQVSVADSIMVSKMPFEFISNLLLIFCCTPFIAGFAILGVKRARGEEIHFKQGFACFKRIIPLFFVQLLTLITLWIAMYGIAFVFLGGLLVLHVLPKVVLILFVLVLAIITLLISAGLMALFSFTYILVIDQNKAPWQAYKTSIKMAWPHLRVLMLAEILYFLFDILGSIPVGVGLLWTVPLTFITTGVFYRQICALAEKK